MENEKNNSKNENANNTLDTILFFAFVASVAFCIFIGYSVKIKGDKQNILTQKEVPFQMGMQGQQQPGR